MKDEVRTFFRTDAHPEVRFIPTAEQELRWLREGIKEALKHLQAGRKTLAIDSLKATLSRETW
jgi:hypothetical protein